LVSGPYPAQRLRQTPLRSVACKGYEEIVSLLLARCPDFNADNGGGMMIIRFAAMTGRTKIVEQLRAQGASLKRRKGWAFPPGEWRASVGYSSVAAAGSSRPEP
jgi:ankyrin repeat protein